MIALSGGEIERFGIDAVDLGLARVTNDDLVGGDPEHNAGVVRSVLGGAGGPHRDIVVLNAGAGFVVGGRADSLSDGIELAADLIDRGDAAATLDRLVAASQDAAA